MNVTPLLSQFSWLEYKSAVGIWEDKNVGANSLMQYLFIYLRFLTFCQIKKMIEIHNLYNQIQA